MAQLRVPLLFDDIDDVILWRDRDGVLRPFSVACAWDTIRTRADIKLKTQDRLRQWDVSPSIDLNLLRCPMCDLIPDSHDHLFFECAFSSHVWSKVHVLCGMDSIPPWLIDVTNFINHISKGKTAVSILSRLVLAITSYYIWLERNGRLFKKKNSSPDQIGEVIISMVRMKLVTFKFKKMSTWSPLLLDQWKIPSYCIVQLRVVLFFPYPRFFPMGFLWMNDTSNVLDLDANIDNENNKNTTNRISVIDEGGSGKKQNFAEMFKKPDAPRVARLNMMTSEQVLGANVAIPLAAVEEISHRFQNTLYGYFIGKRLAFPLVENYMKNAWEKFGLKRVMLTNGFFFFQFATREGMERVLENGPWLIRLVPIILNIWTPNTRLKIPFTQKKNTRLKKDTITSAPVWVKLHHVPIMAFSKISLSLITSHLGKPIMLDAYTSTMCQKSWGRNTYARALIEVSALTPLMESVVIVVPYPDGFGHSFETVNVEYEWQPPRCDSCKVENGDDGFTKVTRKNWRGKQDGKAKQIVGVRLTKPKPNYYYRPVVTPKNNNDNEASSSKHEKLKDNNVQPVSRPNVSTNEGIDLISLRNSFDTLMERDKVLDVADPQSTPTNTNPSDDDEEEV
ncbi:zinc knuckle CX2CX4HX4C containing protein [Tanacetum coccineum]|uniref:Zinc knuckle CX2CX4HX4C containing protein n=1 Tax=Tanacetum coccineum TaxID=301880 RepID=A0ABQ4Y619_9ASTR